MDYYTIETLCFIITLTITLGTQAYINSWYNKTKKIANAKKMTGYEIARLILDKNNLQNVTVSKTRGILSDHYDPRSKAVKLSPDIFENSSIAAASVAAHECGHALQHQQGYFFLSLRNSIIPLVNFASTTGYFAILIGIFASSLNMIFLGIFLEVIILLFQLITLPVEFNASKRALQQLEKHHILNDTEIPKSTKVLTAAALTYVASVATMIIEILRLLLIFTRNND